MFIPLATAAAFEEYPLLTGLTEVFDDFSRVRIFEDSARRNDDHHINAIPAMALIAATGLSVLSPKEMPLT